MSAVPVVLGVLALGGLMAMGGGRRARTTGERVRCTATPAQVARMSRAMAIRWVGCDGRTAVQVAALERAMREARPARGADADAVREYWNASREVLGSANDGAILSDAERAAVNAEEGSDTDEEDEPRGRMVMGPTTIIRAQEARNIAGPLIRALNRRENYRNLLRDFQRAAGITADGRYGGMSFNALRYFGGSNAPDPFVDPPANAPEAAYPPGTDSGYQHA